MSIKYLGPKTLIGARPAFRDRLNRIFARFYQTQLLPGNLFYVGIGLDILQLVLEGLILALQTLHLLLHSPDLGFHPSQL